MHRSFIAYLTTLLAVAAVIPDAVGIRLLAQEPSGDIAAKILVNPAAQGNEAVRTIQEALDRIPSGGKVFVLPGTYAETLTITRGLTLEAIASHKGAAIISPTGTPAVVIEIATNEPVTLRGLTVHVPGAAGIRALGAVDVTIDRATVAAPIPLAAAQSNLVSVGNDLLDGSRARLVVRDSLIDGGLSAPVGQSFLVRAHGDVDALIERNVLRRAGGACIFVVTRADLGGETNADIQDNDLDECHPLGRVGAILVGPIAVNQPSATRPLTATGTVNIVGNTIQNSLQVCLTSAIAYEVYTGRIEHNRIVDFVQPCALPTPRNNPSAIWIGRLSAFPFPAVTPTVRFNDLGGNAQAGLRIAPNQTISIDASCNDWGSSLGPSGIGLGDGSALVVDPGGTASVFTPFALTPIAGTGATGC